MNSPETTSSTSAYPVHKPRISRLIAALGILLVALIVFWAGTAVGYRQAEFSYRWGSHYQDAFAGPGGPFAFRADPDALDAAHGASGTVIGINPPVIAVKRGSEAEKVVVIGPATAIRRLRSQATTTDIHVGDMVIAIGEPDQDGRIVATLIRILPPPPDASTSTAAANAH